jgi:ApbE superfamily uncharacterized protein (UPF0280 family)
VSGPQAHWLPEGRRLHLNHGPIDLIIEAFGEPAERDAAYIQAADRFATVLNELVAELPALRAPAGVVPRAFAGKTACRMEAAVCRFADRFITPMAAVAGSVADEVLSAMTAGRRLDRAYVNDGGDIAIYLSPGTEMKAAIAGTGHGMDDHITIHADHCGRGIATSGWRGRSHSLGIADAVTVLALNAATADAAATLIANAVDLPGHVAIIRKPAHELSPDSDLGAREVTVDVGPLLPGEVAEALERGRAVAEDFVKSGLIAGAALFLNGEARQTGLTSPTLAARQRSALTPPHKEKKVAGVSESSSSLSRVARGGARRVNVDGANAHA